MTAPRAEGFRTTGATASFTFLAFVDHGAHVAATVARDDVRAVQFHPEKNSRVGPAPRASFVANVHLEAHSS